ncbi:MAG TPA: C40 family peptidase [Candidatus Limivivens merdigallinarum]|uniref:C40 family peptidase n=1 Tax=Candidatus Limivivens merdigallinarum TaxID=2840859 RepID=A0A9D1CZG6_9FIRM|nr:C40 family peptidase [Candidatus Limivivens merdigallinarum]
MKGKVTKTLAFCLAGCMVLSLQGVQVMAAEEENSPEIGDLVFAQCEDYINIREEDSMDSEVVAKIYNNSAATIEGESGDWYKIHSGNAVGYVKKEYFATGEEADAIAQTVGYDVARIQTQELNIRLNPNEESTVLTSAYLGDELEIVEYDNGAWMTVVTEDGIYGYVNAYYVDAVTYYPVAETTQEEEERRAAEQSFEESTAAQAESTSTEYTETPATESAVSETESYVAETEAPATESYVPETETPATESYVPETEAPMTESYVPETEAPATESYVPETEAPETESYVPETETPATESYVPETEAPATEGYVPETEAPTTENYVPETEAPATESTSDYSLGQQIADYAVQFIGNPYEWGGTSLTNGADCSGFTQSVLANFGIGIARVAADQAAGGTYVSLDNIQPGDLVFYGSGGIDHVAIYIGGGQIVHAANSESGIITSSLYYSTPVSVSRYW